LERCLEEVSHWMSANRLKPNADKTELLWAGSKYSRLWAARACHYRLTDTVTASNHVRVLSVTFSADLSLDKYVSSICAWCFFWLRQLRRSLDDESMKTLVHTFVTARVDYCDRQTTMGAERRRTSRQRHVQVRPWTVTDSTFRLALAQCGRSGPVQAWRYSPPISPQQSATVSGRLLRSSLRHR